MLGKNFTARGGGWRGLAAAFLLAGVAATGGQLSGAARDGETFSAADVAAGKRAYAVHCATCHGVNLEYGNAPALTGPSFTAGFFRPGATLGDLEAMIHAMPKQAPGSLPEATYHQITAFILSANGVDLRKPFTATQSLGAADEAPGHVAPAAPAEAFPRAPGTVKQARTSAPDDAELVAADPANWLMYNRTYAGDRHSPLDRIDRSNVATLRPVCVMSPGVLGSFQGSPIVYQGTAYVSSAYAVFAFDARTCTRKWEFTHTPDGPEGIVTNRGLAAYDGKLFRGTSDGHLLALDMADGSLLWDAHIADSADGYSVNAAPIAFGGRVIVGLGGGDKGNVGRIYAFDPDTGRRVWTFDTIHAESWPKGAEYGGGGTWTTVAVDVDRRLVLAPVGNPAPDYYLGARPGDNLYTNSVVAIDADSGRIAWHVQQLSGDFHDWDTSAAPALYQSRGRHLMAVGTKAGYLHIYDRDTRKLLAKTNVVTRLNDTVPFSEKPLLVCPGTVSGVEWNGPAYDPATDTVFVNTVDWCATYTAHPPRGWKRGQWYMEGDVAYGAPETRFGWTYALDAMSGKVRWSRKAPSPMIGAVTPTAGGVVFTGGADGMFLALDARDGSELYRFNTGGAIGGGIATYLVDGRQYVAVAAGGYGLVDYGIQGAPSVVVFALPEVR